MKRNQRKNKSIRIFLSAFAIAFFTVVCFTSIFAGTDYLFNSYFNDKPNKDLEKSEEKQKFSKDEKPEKGFSTSEPQTAKQTEPSEKDIPQEFTPSYPEDTEPEISPNQEQDLVNLTLNNQETVAKMPVRSVALTFDDGPSPNHTEDILNILKRHNVRATFFVVGSRAKKHCRILKRIVQEGHELGNHTQNHYFLWDYARNTQTQEIKKTQEIIQQCVDEKPKWFRAPYGAQNQTTLEITRELGLNTALWTIDTNDWQKKSTPRSITQVALKTKGQDVVLMHDGTEPNKERVNDPQVKAIVASDRKSTVQALNQIITTMQNRGLNLVTLSEAFNNRTYADSSKNQIRKIDLNVSKYSIIENDNTEEIL